MMIDAAVMAPAERAEAIGLDAAARPGIQLLRALVTARLGDQHLASEPWRETLNLRILDYVRAHLGDDDLTPARIAAHHLVSRRQLYTTLSRHGVCLSEWIRTQRLERCRDELAAPAARHRSIAAIARHWGFPNAAHFSRTFQTGLRPHPQRLAGSARRPRTLSRPRGLAQRWGGGAGGAATRSG
ncbi:helix-turn-helix domain-containing protein [Streptomyces sp. NPDC056544]|uniref:helix-turn-helix domain-containing protein n=1 Tax=unclassified Streptomyces TaxID=2593676 RepID=UPI00367A4476